MRSEPAPTTGVLLARVDPDGGDDATRPLYRGDGGSFATYFSAFPASYWQRWTVLDEVELRVRTSTSGHVRVWRSDAEGHAVEAAALAVDAAAEAVVRLPLDVFPDGGWYWFELEDAELADAGWWAPADRPAARPCRASLGITTLNREEYLLPLLRRIAADDDVMELLDRVFVIDHGSRRVRDADGFAEAEAALAGRLSLVEQANIGGSGGFSRSMLEALDAGSDAVILLDDDVAIDPESIRRMTRFAEYTTEPTVVGGHMFDMHRRGRLLALSEGFRMDRFLWTAFGPSREDISTSDLRGTAWLHRRGDAEYTGWWMCLIPSTVLRAAGLSMPFFIKWDDAEYGLRATEHGAPIVTLPGAAVWHVSWDDKDDTVDWQAYYHARNRLVAALLHSPDPRGGKAVLQEVLLAVKNVLALEYGAQAIRNAGYLDVLAGPGRMHAELGTRLAEIRFVLTSYASGRSLAPGDVPEPTGPAPRGWDTAQTIAPRGRRTAELALPLLLRMLLPVRTVDAPQARLTFERTRWWITGRFDTVLVATADESSLRWLRRDRRVALGLLRDAWRLTRRIRREWPRLAAEYRAALPDLVSIERWRETTGAPVSR